MCLEGTWSRHGVIMWVRCGAGILLGAVGEEVGLVDLVHHLQAVVWAHHCARMVFLVEELGALHQLDCGLIFLLLKQLENLVLERIDLKFVDKDLLFLVFNRLLELSDSRFVF